MPLRCLCPFPPSAITAFGHHFLGHHCLCPGHYSPYRNSRTGKRSAARYTVIRVGRKAPLVYAIRSSERHLRQARQTSSVLHAITQQRWHGVTAPAVTAEFDWPNRSRHGNSAGRYGYLDQVLVLHGKWRVRRGEIPQVKAISVRDSKAPEGPSLAFAPSSWNAFVTEVSRGVPDHG